MIFLNSRAPVDRGKLKADSAHIVAEMKAENVLNLKEKVIELLVNPLLALKR